MTDRQARNLEDKMRLSLKVAQAPFPHLENGWLPTRDQIIEWATVRAGLAFEPKPLESLLVHFEGKGIGGTKEILTQYTQNVFAGIRDGLFNLAGYRDDCRGSRMCGEFVALELTEKGMRFFAAIPRLEEVWA